MEDTNCPICYELYSDNNVCTTKCGHKFHTSCFVETIKSTKVTCCPLCRTDTGLDKTEEEKEQDRQRAIHREQLIRQQNMEREAEYRRQLREREEMRRARELSVRIRNFYENDRNFDRADDNKIIVKYNANINNLKYNVVNYNG